MRFLKQYKSTFILLLLLLVLLIGNVFFISRIMGTSTSTVNLSEIQPAISTMNTTQLDEFFRTIAQEEGALTAFDVLRQVTLPFGADAHVIGHTIGTVLYKQRGIEGIRYCTDEFNNSCSHAIVIEHFSQHGENVISEIAKECRQAPGGKHGYNMCFHGLGHGVFSYFAYNFEKTIPVCQKVWDIEKNRTAYSECIGGAVMEGITGGQHDRETWTVNTKKYFIATDPLYPCNSTIFPNEAKPMCYMYLTPYLFELAGFKIGEFPTDPQLKKAFSFCEAIKEDDLRNICFEGFGKELVTMANDWDSNVGGKTQFGEEKTKKLSRWCHTSGTKEGKLACISNSVAVLYWGGARDIKYADNLCQMQETDQEKLLCYNRLVQQIAYFSNKPQATCKKINTDWQDMCNEKLEN